MEQQDSERNIGTRRPLFVPFMSGAALFHTHLSVVKPKQKVRALNDLLDIGQVLWELTEDEEQSSVGFHALPQEYQDWIQSLLHQILARLKAATRPRSSAEI